MKKCKLAKKEQKTMTLHEFIQSFPLRKLRDVLSFIQAHYYTGNEEVRSWDKHEGLPFWAFFSSLTQIKPTESDFIIHVTFEESVFNTRWGVWGEIKDDEDKANNRYAIETAPWEEWLAAEIDPATLVCFKGQEVALLGHIAWEMAYFGYLPDQQEKKVAEFRESIRQSEKEYEEGLYYTVEKDEQGDPVFVPSANLKKKLEEEENAKGDLP